MKKKVLQEALDGIPENYLEEAIQYRKEKAKISHLWLAAACLLLLFITGIPQHTAKAVVAEVKQIQYLSHGDALALEPLGDYFPAVLPDGYEWEEDGIQLRQSGTDVLSGSCYNPDTGDHMKITVAVQSYFGIQTWNIEEPVRDGDQIGSQLYMDFGDFAVHYYASDVKLSEIQGFEEMHFSASVHKPRSGGFRMVTSRMYDPISEREVLMHLSLNAENMTAWQMTYPLSQMLTGTYSLEDHQMIVTLSDNNGGTYRFTYTVITRDLIVLQEIDFDEKAAYGEWIKAHVPLDSVMYRNDLWSDTNLKENQY